MGALRHYSATLRIREKATLYAKASATLEKVDDEILASACDASPECWTLREVLGDSTLVRVAGCAPLLGDNVSCLWLTM